MAGLGGRRRRRKWQLIALLGALAITASTAYAIRQLAHGNVEPADTAGLMGLPLGVAGLVVAVVALRKPIEGNDAELARGWAATLAGQVESGESAVWRQLLGDDTRRINLAYQLHPAGARPATAPAAGRLADDGAGTALPDVVSYYRATRPLRLVITGVAGAGKTVLALELLLALIDGREGDGPVPVRIPLSRWNTERQTLPELLQQRLVEAYDWPKNLAAGLIRHHMVLPVLDGLDEMDPQQPDGSPDPAAPRATAVIHALNAYQHGRDAGPLILTCRTHHYEALASHAEVVDAARITIVPTNPEDACTYLKARALHPVRWQPLLDHLTTHPGSPLAATLSTPWRLCLTATVYHRDGHPTELLSLPDADSLDRHLLARYIPAATRTTPNPHGYTTQDIHRWLHRLTTHLDPASPLGATASAGADSTDLVLHEIWPLAGRARVRAADTILTTLTVLTPLPLCWAVSPPLSGLVALVTGVSAAMAGALAAPENEPGRVINPLRTAEGRRYLAVALVLGLALGLALYLMTWFEDRLALWLMTGCTGGLVGWFLLALGTAPGPSLDARAVIKSDAFHGLAVALSVSLTLGLTAALVLGANGWGADGLAAGLASGLPFGLALGLYTGGSSRRYTVFLLCAHRRLPFRLGRFLDWAVTAGLMRDSGPAYQYRHRELQHWLRQHPQPPAGP